MKSKLFKLLSITVSICLISLAIPFASAAEDVTFVFHKIDLDQQIVELRKADGSTAKAEFVGELIFLPDGRANGGFGLWEAGGANALSLYRVIEGRELNRLGPFFEFKAKRLSPASEEEITINLRPSPGHAPAGSVTFLVDGISTLDGQPASFKANGKVRSHAPTPTLTDFVLGFNYINAPPQTIVVETRHGTFSAIFENVALVFPDGEAIGFASLSASENGGPIFIRLAGGKLHFDGEEPGFGVLHGQATRPVPARPLPVLLVIADMQDFSEPCRIYDIAGWQPRKLHFEAETEITRFSFGER